MVNAFLPSQSSLPLLTNPKNLWQHCFTAPHTIETHLCVCLRIVSTFSSRLKCCITFLSPRPSLWSSGQSSWLQKGDVLCFLWGKNWIYICYVEESGPTLWSSGQSSWLQFQRPGFDFLRYHIFWEVVGLERGPFSLVSTIEELLGRKSGGSVLENRLCGSGDPSPWPRGTLYPHVAVAQSVQFTSWLRPPVHCQQPANACLSISLRNNQ
jgi:hypothetical protein